jgi:hypothetical protein
LNAVTFHKFLLEPFTWPDGSIARFMWWWLWLSCKIMSRCKTWAIKNQNLPVLHHFLIVLNSENLTSHGFEMRWRKLIVPCWIHAQLHKCVYLPERLLFQYQFEVILLCFQPRWLTHWNYWKHSSK